MHSTKLVGRLGSIDINKEWDAVLLVLLDQNYDTIKIFEAPRGKVIKAITEPGSKARNERGALSVPAFCAARLSRQAGRVCLTGRMAMGLLDMWRERGARFYARSTRDRLVAGERSSQTIRPLPSCA
jgi:hypothetical protein